MINQNFKEIIIQLRTIAENINKIVAKNNNSWKFLIPSVVALILGVVGVFQDKIRYFFFKPKLEVDIQSFLINNNPNKPAQYDFLFKVSNVGKSTLEDAEALVEPIYELNPKEKELIIPLPFNMAYKAKGGITIEKIPPNTSKLFEFGSVIKPKSKNENISANYSSPEKIEFVLIATGDKIKSYGEYEIIVTFSGNNINPLKKTYKLTLHDKWATDSGKIKEMAYIEEYKC